MAQGWRNIESDKGQARRKARLGIATLQSRTTSGTPISCATPYGNTRDRVTETRQLQYPLTLPFHPAHNPLYPSSLPVFIPSIQEQLTPQLQESA